MNELAAAGDPVFAFEREQAVRFGHCDPAGIVFFPRYYEMLNECVEDWFTQALQIPFAELLGPRQVGLPTVRLETVFQRPSRMGDSLRQRLAVLRLGRSSLQLLHRFEGPDGLRVQFHQWLVCTSLQTHRSQVFPEDVRAAIEALRERSSR